MITEPTISFSKWRPWSSRESTISYDLIDIPKDFDVSGIYLLAHFKTKKQREYNGSGQLHLNPNVVYIGKSRRITGRLEGSRHEKLRNEYQKLFNDTGLKYLYFSICHTGWTTCDFQKKDLGKALNAFLLYIERKLIWEFAQTYSRIPILNRE